MPSTLMENMRGKPSQSYSNGLLGPRADSATLNLHRPVNSHDGPRRSNSVSSTYSGYHPANSNSAIVKPEGAHYYRRSRYDSGDDGDETSSMASFRSQPNGYRSGPSSFTSHTSYRSRRYASSLAGSDTGRDDDTMSVRSMQSVSSMRSNHSILSADGSVTGLRKSESVRSSRKKRYNEVSTSLTQGMSSKPSLPSKYRESRSLRPASPASSVVSERSMMSVISGMPESQHRMTTPSGSLHHQVSLAVPKEVRNGPITMIAQDNAIVVPRPPEAPLQISDKKRRKKKEVAPRQLENNDDRHIVIVQTSQGERGQSESEIAGSNGNGHDSYRSTSNLHEEVRSKDSSTADPEVDDQSEILTPPSVPEKDDNASQTHRGVRWKRSTRSRPRLSALTEEEEEQLGIVKHAEASPAAAMSMNGGRAGDGVQGAQDGSVGPLSAAIDVGYDRDLEESANVSEDPSGASENVAVEAALASSVDLADFAQQVRATAAQDSVERLASESVSGLDITNPDVSSDTHRSAEKIAAISVSEAHAQALSEESSQGRPRTSASVQQRTESVARPKINAKSLARSLSSRAAFPGRNSPIPRFGKAPSQPTAEPTPNPFAFQRSNESSSSGYTDHSEISRATSVTDITSASPSSSDHDDRTIRGSSRPSGVMGPAGPLVEVKYVIPPGVSYLPPLAGIAPLDFGAVDASNGIVDARSLPVSDSLSRSPSAMSASSSYRPYTSSVMTHQGSQGTMDMMPPRPDTSLTSYDRSRFAGDSMIPTEMQHSPQSLAALPNLSRQASITSADWRHRDDAFATDAPLRRANSMISVDRNRRDEDSRSVAQSTVTVPATSFQPNVSSLKPRSSMSNRFSAQKTPLSMASVCISGFAKPSGLRSFFTTSRSVQPTIRASHYFAGLSLSYNSTTSAPKKLNSSEVLVAVYAASLDIWDTVLVKDQGRRGRKGWGFIPGRSFCGRVLEVGFEVDTERLKKGDLVFGLSDLKKSGALAEYITVHKTMLCRAPVTSIKNPLTIEAVASLPYAAITAHHAVYFSNGLDQRSRVLVIAGHSGVGAYACQLLAYGIGCVVTTTCPPSTGDEGVSVCHKNGAASVIRSGPLAALEDTKTLSTNSFDMVIDTIGGRATYLLARRVIRDGGYFVTVGGDEASKVPGLQTSWRTSLRSLRKAFSRSKDDGKVIGYEYIGAEGPLMDGARDSLEAVQRAATNGIIRASIRKIVPLEEAPAIFSEIELDDPGLIIVNMTNLRR